ncbi:uncharacterized protein F4807DRAFT_261511 [Annulohypoxylon truncatum]|uniref:uncharacterized protein n=1 Tax=Annulohypoxylon truncatum TaxID=327061 RepID=UPI002007C22E|nr:uncharacterized protein F4807DRAFT_261511 [Annulohypoxylon truncatum]KAI1213355.1 hypothetical protein F4807DRAFT_261511 [Annulohypoxylon truncatum]
MTAVTRTSRGDDGTISETTYIMPEQTTPYAPLRSASDTLTGTGSNMPNSCSLSVFCRSASYYVYSMATAAHSPHPLSGQHCNAVQRDPGWGQLIGFHDDCWPQNYFALFPYEWAEMNGASKTTNEGDGSTVAFPGGHCLEGWTTACTTTITAGGLRHVVRDGAGNEVRAHDGEKEYYPQAWCCPPGEWACATQTGDGDRQAPQRLCRSVLTGTATTQIWMSWDPAYYTFTPTGSSSSIFEAYTWTADVPEDPDPENAATVFHKVFPLVLSTSGSWSSSTTSSSSSSTSSSSSSSSGSGSGSGSGSDDMQPRIGEDLPTVEGSDIGCLVTLNGTETVTVSVTPSVEPRIIGREEPFAFGDAALTSRCVVAGLLGAAAATVTLLLMGFGILYRQKNRDRRRRDAATAADGVDKGLLKDEKFETEMGVRFQG